jgi:hypothetical protein
MDNKILRNAFQYIKEKKEKVDQAKTIYDQIDKHKLHTANDMQYLINSVDFLLKLNKEYRDYMLNPEDNTEIHFEEDRKSENEIFKQFEEIKNRYGDVQQ